MQDSKALFMKVIGVKQIFFQCLHSFPAAEQVHPGQGPMLGYLLRHGGGSQADIVRQMRVSAATVAVSVARMEKLGLITKERNQSNQRANVLKLTERGRVVAAQMDETMATIADAALAGFSGEERQNLENYCQRMRENLQTKFGEKE